MARESSRLHGRRIGNAVSTISAGSLYFLIHIKLLVQAHLQHYTEPSAEPIPATSSISSTTLLPLGPGTLTHNAAGVPIIVVCTKADQIDEGSDVIGAGTAGMGGMVKGKGDDWEERTDGVMQIMRTICLKCKSSAESTYTGC